jgi:hypothetical protein
VLLEEEKFTNTSRTTLFLKHFAAVVAETMNAKRRLVHNIQTTSGQVHTCELFSPRRLAAVVYDRRLEQLVERSKTQSVRDFPLLYTWRIHQLSPETIVSLYRRFFIVYKDHTF